MAMEKRKSRSYIKTPDGKADNLSLRQAVDPGVLYKTYCLTCHQSEGQGDENINPPLAGSEWVNGKKEDLIQTVLFGLQGEIQVKNHTYNQIMPSFSFLSDEQLAAEITYIKNNFGNHGDKVTPAEVSAVRNNRK